MKKSCLYYYNLKCLFSECLIATNHAMQNSTNLIDTLEVMKDRHLVNLVNNMNSDVKNSLVCHKDDKLDSDRNREGEDNSKDPRSKRPDHRQNQRIPRTAPNTRYYNFSNHF